MHTTPVFADTLIVGDTYIRGGVTLRVTKRIVRIKHDRTVITLYSGLIWYRWLAGDTLVRVNPL